MRLRAGIPLAVAAMALVSVTPILALASEPMQVKSYAREFFADFAPSTALDMVGRVPGFTLNEGETRRGFGDTGGNVLINGARPGSKAGGPREALSRIPASAVVRIDLVTNPTSSEASGQSVIVDLILRETDVSGSWSASLTRTRDEALRPTVNASLSGPIAGWRTSGSIQFRPWSDPSDGTRRRTGPTGELQLFEQMTGEVNGLQVTLSGDARREALGGEFAVNGRFDGYDVDVRFARRGFIGRLPAGSVDQLQGISFDDPYLSAELGGEWSRRFSNAATLKVLSLVSWTQDDSDSGNRIERPLGTRTSETLSISRRNLIEWVGRATVSAGEGRLRPEFGGEAAFNRLDSKLSLTTRDSAGTLIPISLPAANVVVDEYRTEAFLNLAYDVSPRWTLDAKVASEWSEISVSGDARNRQRLQFLKPEVSLSWRPAPDLSVVAGVRRSVGQLDFDSFAASAEVGSDRTQGGNAQLRPQIETRASLDLDVRGQGGLALNASVFHEWREDVLEPIILPGGAFGVGNAKSARVWGARIGASAPLSWLARGMRLDANGEWRESVFDDPLTGRSRRLTDFTPWTYSVELRQDLPERKLSWSAKVSGEDKRVSYYVPEFSAFSMSPEVRLTVESTYWQDLKVSLTVLNPLGRRFTTDRTFFSPTRASAVTGREARRWEEGPDVSLTVKRSF
ncbi:MAG: hypothetical protein INF01_13780 [Phenylobacterium sp.]|nr:hypothetical protein [Phenylobacterium sp.]